MSQDLILIPAGGGTPGGNSGDHQYNNAGAFGGFADGTSTQVLHGGRTFGQVVNGDIANSTIDLAAKVTGLLPSANAGVNQVAAGFGGMMLPKNDFEVGSTYTSNAIAANALFFLEIEIDRYISVIGGNIDFNGAVNGAIFYVALYDSAGNLALELKFTSTASTGVIAGALTTNPSVIKPGSYTMAYGSDTSSASLSTIAQAYNAAARLLRGTTRTLTFKTSQISGGHVPGTLPGSRSDPGAGNYTVPAVYLLA